MKKEINLDMLYLESVMKLGRVQTSEEIKLRNFNEMESRRKAKVIARREIRAIEKAENRKFGEIEKLNYLNKAVHKSIQIFRIEVIKLANSYA